MSSGKCSTLRDFLNCCKVTHYKGNVQEMMCISVFFSCISIVRQNTGGRLQRRIGGRSLSWGADRPRSLRSLVRSVPPGYSEVSLSAEVLLQSPAAPCAIGTPSLASFTDRTPCFARQCCCDFAELKVFKEEGVAKQ